MGMAPDFSRYVLMAMKSAGSFVPQQGGRPGAASALTQRLRKHARPAVLLSAKETVTSQTRRKPMRFPPLQTNPLRGIISSVTYANPTYYR